MAYKTILCDSIMVDTCCKFAKILYITQNPNVNYRLRLIIMYQCWFMDCNKWWRLGWTLCVFVCVGEYMGTFCTVSSTLL